MKNIVYIEDKTLFLFRGAHTNLLDGDTNNGTSDTDGLSRSLLGNALIFALLVEASP